MANNNVRCKKCGRVCGQSYQSEVELYNVTLINRKSFKIRFKCKGCLAINNLNENNESEFNEKDSARSILDNFSNKPMNGKRNT